MSCQEAGGLTQWASMAQVEPMVNALLGQIASLLHQSRAGVVAAMVAACSRTQAGQAAVARAVAQCLASPASKVCLQAIVMHMPVVQWR